MYSLQRFWDFPWCWKITTPIYYFLFDWDSFESPSNASCLRNHQPTRWNYIGGTTRRKPLPPPPPPRHYRKLFSVFFSIPRISFRKLGRNKLLVPYTRNQGSATDLYWLLLQLPVFNFCKGETKSSSESDDVLETSNTMSLLGSAWIKFLHWNVKWPTEILNWMIFKSTVTKYKCILF